MSTHTLPNSGHLRFDGADYDRDRDNIRLGEQCNRVFGLMMDGEWRTLGDIARLCSAPTPSVSAQLRHLRKPRFGGWNVERRHVGNGLYEYRINGKAVRSINGIIQDMLPL